MKTAAFVLLSILALGVVVGLTEAFPSSANNHVFPLCATALSARGGRGKKKLSSSTGTASDNQKSSRGFANTNWISIPAPAWDISKAKEDKVELFDTNLVTLKDTMTNPTGAVSVLKHKGEVFCFDSSCPSCKIPLSSAKVLPAKQSSSDRPSPVIACSFCKSAYNLRTGEKVEVSPEEAGGGLFAGLAQNLFKASGTTDPLKMYQLGEKDGKILISLD